MTRRTMFGSLGAGAAALAAHAAATAAAQQPAATARDPHAPEAHLDTLARCVKACNAAAAHCFQALTSGSGGDAKSHATLYAVATDCQAFCVLTGTLMARNSTLVQPAHVACAEACAQCAALCEKHEQMGAVIKECAAACRACETACREMAAHHGHNHDH